MDSAAAGIGPPIDVVHVDLADVDGLRAECELARSLGFGGDGVVAVDGEMVDRPVYARALDIIEERRSA